MKDDIVKTKAKVLSNVDNVKQYSLGSFDAIAVCDKDTNNIVAPIIEPTQETNQQNQQNNNIDSEKILNEISILHQQINAINNSISSLKDLSFSNKELDEQIVKALKDLKQYATFYKEASLSFEQKLLKTSFSIAKKIIGIEISQNSAQIAKETIDSLMGKLKNASTIKIHLNPKDYTILKDEIEVDNVIDIIEDSNVMPGGVVIASDLGNFDGNVDAKIESIFQALEILS
jgi:flagellar assembly protein FliH